MTPPHFQPSITSPSSNAPHTTSPSLEPFITLFETLLRTPQPWYFAHATVREAGRARSAGTLMRVANTKRTADGRLQVLVETIDDILRLDTSGVLVQVSGLPVALGPTAIFVNDQYARCRKILYADKERGLRIKDVARAQVHASAHASAACEARRPRVKIGRAHV